MHLSRSTIATVLGTESPEIRREGDATSFALMCSIDGTLACRFSTGTWNYPALDALAERIVDEVGWKIVEHAARHRVLVRCDVAGGEPARARCTIDRGSGPEPLPVLADV